MSSTTTTTPTGRYGVDNHGLSLLEDGKFVGVSAVPPLRFQAWNLEKAPEDIATPGKDCYILSNANSNLFLATGGMSNIWGPQGSAAPSAAATKDQSDIVLVPLDATVTAHRSDAWVFILDGVSNGTGKFEGKIVSPDGIFTFGLYQNGAITSLTPATAYMSPDSSNTILDTNWKLQMLVLDETK